MSVTFHATGHPPDWQSLADGPPFLNVANANAVAVAVLLGLTLGNVEHGGVPAERVPELARSVMRWRNGADLSALVRPSRGGVADGGASYIEVGLPLRRLEGYLDALDEILTFAADHGVGLTWS